jgi:hypothetical protein
MNPIGRLTISHTDHDEGPSPCSLTVMPFITTGIGMNE